MTRRPFAKGAFAALLTLALLLTACQGGQQAATQSPDPVVATQTPEPVLTPTPEPQPVTQTVRFSASGDNLIHDGLFLQAARRAAENGNPDGLQYDFAYAYEPMRAFLAQFDVNWINQETLVNNLYEPSGYPQFSTPTDITKALYDVGYRVFSLSNNHSYDKHADGIESSLAHWATMPDDTVTMGFYNTETYDEYAYHTVNGITIGYLSYTQHTNGLPVPEGAAHRVILLEERDLIAQQMAQMRPNCDILVVSCHWGDEGYHMINDFQLDTAQFLSDHGADLIIGTHPHVTQSAQWLTAADGRSTFVVYSLGNFVSAQAAPDNMIGTVLDITFEKVTQSDGSVSVQLLNPRLWPVVTQYEDGYSNIRVYPYRDYTDALGAAHGNFTLSRAYIEEVLRNSVDETFLDFN